MPDPIDDDHVDHLEWITEAPPVEWKAGMLVLVKDYRGQETVEVIGSITAWHPGLSDLPIGPVHRA